MTHSPQRTPDAVPPADADDRTAVSGAAEGNTPRLSPPAPAGSPAEAEGTERLRAAMVRELVRLDIAYRRGAGEAPVAEDYLSRFPGLDRAWLAGALAAPAERSLATPAPSRPE